MARVWIAAAAVIAATSSLGTALGAVPPLLPLNEETTSATIVAPVGSVEVTDDVGDVVASAGAPTRVVATVRWNLVRPVVTITVSGGVLRVEGRCPNVPLNDCSIDFDIVIPTTASLAAETGAGDVRGSGLGGASTSAESGAGDVILSAIRSPVVRGTTGAGELAVDLLTVPSSVRLDTGAGDIDARVPPGVYDVRAHTGAGSVTITGISQSASSTHRIDASAGAGDITIRGR